MKPVTFPVLDVKLVPISKVIANDYNPNKVATKEFELLCLSIEEDGMTQPVVTFYDEIKDLYVVVDGFHRYKALKEYFKSDMIAVVTIQKDINQRMASTIRHNRARGKHEVELQSELVRSLIENGESDSNVCNSLGLTSEEFLRLKQVSGIAQELSNKEYGKSWEVAND